ncbi:MAG: Nif3-like dinuclear metal center hexameric protein [Clostridiales bacterium]|nr:Nif3-like dinuclear metal center hexameric protein [Clostridiales bacterium]
MVKCKDVIAAMEEIAPTRLAYSWDNPGLMTGDRETGVKKILVSLDIDDNVITEAIDKGANLIVTHHPMIFRPVKSVTTDDKTGRYLMRLIKNDIAVFSAHTNLDMSNIGTNAELAKLLGLKNTCFLMPSEDGVYAMGRVGELEEKKSVEDFALFVKEKLGLKNMVVSKAGEYVSKIGLCTGHGCDKEFLQAAAEKGCDGYVSGDIGYHEAQEALAMGISLFDGTHYGTETIVTKPVAEFLRSRFDIEIIRSETDGQTLKIL